MDKLQQIELGEVGVKDLTPDEIFLLTQSVRIKLVEKLAKSIPTDFDRGTLLLGALKDLDNQVIAKSKLELESERNKTDQEVKAVLAQALMNRAADNTTNVPVDYVPTLPSDLDIQLVEGQTDTKPHQIEYDHIMG